MPLNKISNNAMDRVSKEMKVLIEDPDVMFDVHCHIFNFDFVPNGYLGIRIPFTHKFFKGLENLLHRIISSRDTDVLSNIAYFIKFGRTRSTIDIAKKLFSYYGQKTIFCPLMMDMQPKKHRGIKGKLKIDFPQQMNKMKQVMNKTPDKVLPFVAIDPRRDNVFNDIFLKGFSFDYNFFGIKIYPCLGYMPSHPELMRIFEVCEDKNIPVIAHCSGASVKSSYHYLRNIEGIRRINENHETKYKKFKENKWLLRRQSYARYFNNPRNWEPVLHSFPRLRLDLGHFGGDKEWMMFLKGKTNTWVSRIIDLIYRYDNVYADISFNIYNHKTNDLLRKLLENNKRLAERTLYGSDFYMVVVKGHFRCIKTDFMVIMGDRIIYQIASVNPKKFLGLN